MMVMTINMLIADDYDEYDGEYGLCEWWVWGIVDHTVSSMMMLMMTMVMTKVMTMMMMMMSMMMNMGFVNDEFGES